MEFTWRYFGARYYDASIGGGGSRMDAAGRRVRKSEDLDRRFYLFSGPDVLVPRLRLLQFLIALSRGGVTLVYPLIARG